MSFRVKHARVLTLVLISVILDILPNKIITQLNVSQLLYRDAI